MRIMAVDYGDARTGIAISDPAGLIAGFTTVIHTQKMGEAARETARLAQERGVEEIVVGFPRNMDGTESLRAGRYREFAALVEKESGKKPILWDERRTTVEAHEILHAAGKKMKKHRETVDAVAASLILEGYLTRRRSSETG